jgi:hypothetical protein
VYYQCRHDCRTLHSQSNLAPTDAQAILPAKQPAETTTAPQGLPKESGEIETISLQGRLGRDPWFSQGEDSPIAGFPLAINAESQTTWHKVVVFDEMAVWLKEQMKRGDIRKGRLVDVRGKSVTREEETARGSKKIVEFQASEIKRVKATRAR